jgi:hypothetical protein
MRHDREGDDLVLVHEPVSAVAPATHPTRTTVVHADQELTSVLRDAAAGRLRLLCSHGYSADPDAGPDGCAQCAAYGVMGGH